MPGTDVKPLIAELRDRMEEELDYRDEADNQRAFAEVFEVTRSSRCHVWWRRRRGQWSASG